MGRCPELERVQHATELFLDHGGRIAGDLERLVHDLRTMVPDGPGREFDAVAHDVVLERVDGERVLGEERFQATLWHRERVVAELDLVGVFVEFVHREIDDPAELELLLVDEIELLAEARAHGAGELRGGELLVAGKEHGIAVLQAGSFFQLRQALFVEVLGDWALGAGRFIDDVAETGGAARARPFVELVEERTRLRRGTRCRNGAHDRTHLDGLGKDAEAGAAENLGHIGVADRVPEIRLVGAVAQHRFLERDARERHRRDDAIVREFLEHAMQHRFDRLEHVFLGHERHLEIELIKLAGRTVGATVLVAEAGGDLEIAIEARHHQELLELLRRLRQRVELAGMKTRGHQEVARPFRRG